MPDPDIILYNGRIYPQAEPRPVFEALAVWKRRVTDLGSDRQILSLRGKHTRTMNLRGRTVLPGFCDSHIHLLNYGMLLQTLDLSKTLSIDEMKRQVALKGSSEKSDDWVLGRGWDDEKLLDHRYPNRHDLDSATSRPVFLKRICGHVAVANTKALKLSGITRHTPDPDGGIIVRDPDGQPNGVLKERAIEIVENDVPQRFDEDRRALVLAARKLAKLGITSLHCIVSDLNELVALRRLKHAGGIHQSIYAIVPLKLLDQLVSLGWATESGEDGFRVGGVKLYLDGSLGARTAALQSAYSDDQSSMGMLTMRRDELERVVLRARDAGFQLCIHAIGDRAVELAIEVLAKSFGTSRGRKSRNRIEHASIASTESISRMRKLGIIASVQPRFIYSDSWACERLGAERLKHLYPFRSFLRAGIVLAAGSDCPVEDPNPFEGVWSATMRPGLGAGERLTVGQALASYSKNAAYASFCEDARGSLESGKMADLVVLDRDPFSCDPTALRTTRVLKTIIGGRVVSQKQSN